MSKGERPVSFLGMEGFATLARRPQLQHSAKSGFCGKAGLDYSRILAGMNTILVALADNWAWAGHCPRTVCMGQETGVPY